MKDSLKTFIMVVVIVVVFLLVLFGWASIRVHMDEKGTSRNQYELVPLKNTENNKVFYLYPNNNGTYTYYYVSYIFGTGEEYYYSRGIIEENATLIIEANYDNSVTPSIEKFILCTNGKKHIYYTIYAPLDNVFGEFKLDSDAENFKPTF